MLWHCWTIKRNCGDSTYILHPPTLHPMIKSRCYCGARTEKNNYESIICGMILSSSLYPKREGGRRKLIQIESIHGVEWSHGAKYNNHLIRSQPGSQRTNDRYRRRVVNCSSKSSRGGGKLSKQTFAHFRIMKLIKSNKILRLSWWYGCCQLNRKGTRGWLL